MNNLSLIWHLHALYYFLVCVCANLTTADTCTLYIIFRMQTLQLRCKRIQKGFLELRYRNRPVFLQGECDGTAVQPMHAPHIQPDHQQPQRVWPVPVLPGGHRTWKCVQRNHRAVCMSGGHGRSSQRQKAMCKCTYSELNSLIWLHLYWKIEFSIVIVFNAYTFISQIKRFWHDFCLL